DTNKWSAPLSAAFKKYSLISHRHMAAAVGQFLAEAGAAQLTGKTEYPQFAASVGETLDEVMPIAKRQSAQRCRAAGISRQGAVFFSTKGLLSRGPRVGSGQKPPAESTGRQCWATPSRSPIPTRCSRSGRPTPAGCVPSRSHHPGCLSACRRYGFGPGLEVFF